MISKSFAEWQNAGVMDTRPSSVKEDWSAFVDGYYAALTDPLPPSPSLSRSHALSSCSLSVYLFPSVSPVNGKSTLGMLVVKLVEL